MSEGRSGRLWRGLLIVSVVAVPLSVGGVALYRALVWDVPDDFWEAKGTLLTTEPELVDSDSTYDEYRLVLRSTSGLEVRGHLRVPREPGSWPGLVVIGGVNTGRLGARLINPDRPYVILGLDYPWQGSTRLTAWEFLLRLLKIRGAMLRTPSAVLLAVDYLQTRDDVHADSVGLVGSSFGAQLATVAAGIDDRISPLVLVYGGGDFAKLIRANLHFDPGWLRSAVAAIGAQLLDPVEPLRYVGDVAPRPVVLVNGENDDRIPRVCVELLYEAAGLPKRLVWLDAGHISSRNEELLERVLEAAVDALSTIDTQGQRATAPRTHRPGHAREDTSSSEAYVRPVDDT